MSTRGICKLCTLEKDLQDSHFIGRAVYRKLMEPSLRNPQPIIVTANTMKQSPIQIRDYVFCFDCEQIFNSGGEAWMHGHIATTAGFRLLDLFTGQPPIFNEPDLILYDAAKIPSVDCSAILEYGMGVFLKAAVHTWRFEDGTTSHIDLGPERTEVLRKFIHREGSFPHDMVLTVCLSSRAKQFWGVIPPLRMQPQGTEEERYYFHVSGVYYCLLVGSSIDPKMKMLAFNNSRPVRPVLVGEEWGDQAFDIMRKLARSVPASPKLKRGLKPKL